MPRRVTLALLFAGAWVSLLLAIGSRAPWELHRDELLYLAMGDRLQLWRMDFPPFIAIVANGVRSVFGESNTAIRSASALAGTMLVLVAATLATTFAREAAHRARRASLFAALLMLTAPVFLRSSILLQPVVFDQLWWTLALSALALRIAHDDVRWWLAVGAALGLGLLTKFSIAFIGVGIVVGVLVTPLRRDLGRRWPWCALALALTIGAPSLVGQWQLDWPVLWQMRGLASEQLDRRAWWEFFAEQPTLVGPVVGLVSTVGLAQLLRVSATRALGIAVLVAWGWLALSGGKGYYGAPVYPTMIAAGAVALAGERRAFRIVRAACAVLAVGFGVFVLPLALPVRSPEATAAYAAAIGATSATTTNTGGSLPLPQDFADMLGWDAMTRAAVAARALLPDSVSARTVYFAPNYGRAGALLHYGRALGVREVISPAGSFWYFGSGPEGARHLIALGGVPRAVRALFARCETTPYEGHPMAVDEERAFDITRCFDAHAPLASVWDVVDPGGPR